jgi:hypothetical protein
MGKTRPNVTQKNSKTAAQPPVAERVNQVATGGTKSTSEKEYAPCQKKESKTTSNGTNPSHPPQKFLCH